MYASKASPVYSSSRSNKIIAIVILYNIFLTLTLLLVALHFDNRVRILEDHQQCNEELREEIPENKRNSTYSTETADDSDADVERNLALDKRLVLSDTNIISELMREPTAVALSGAVYVRWGRKDCPDQSKLIYHGLAAGSDFRSPGGGSNLQCLPSDPQYDPKYSHINVQNSVLSKVMWDGHNHFGNLFRRQIPCSVCESKERVSKLMIPAATQCPTSDWRLEYKGFLVSELNVDNNGGTRHYRSTYECLDEYPVTFKPNEGESSTAGTLMRLTRVSCSGDTSINYCPPYKENQPISCVLCTK